MIVQGARVRLHFSLRLESGELIDDTRSSGQPASFTLGDKNLLPGFERPLIGLKAGDKRSFLIAADDAVGVPNPKNVRHVDKKAFASVIEPSDLKPGLVLGFPDAQGQEIPGVVKRVGVDSLEVDFNHPLAGQTIVFDVDILDVQPPAL